MSKVMVAAVMAFSLTAAPVLAQARPLSVAGAQVRAAPSDEGANQIFAGLLLPLLALLAAVAIIAVVADDDEPRSA